MWEMQTQAVPPLQFHSKGPRQKFHIFGPTVLLVCLASRGGEGMLLLETAYSVQHL